MDQALCLLLLISNFIAVWSGNTLCIIPILWSLLSYLTAKHMVYPGDWSMGTWEVYSWWRTGEKGNLVHSWWECKLVQFLWKTVWCFLKLKTELSYNLAILFLGIYLRKMKILTWKDIGTSMFTEALFIMPKRLKNPKYPLGCPLAASSLVVPWWLRW